MLDTLSHAQHFVTLWIVAHQAPLSMGFPRQDTGVGCHFLFLEIFLTQGSNAPLLQWQAPSLPLSRQGSPAITCIAVVSVAQSCPTLCDPMDCSPTGSSVHRIFQARMLEWVVISYSRRSSQPREWITSLRSPALAGRFFTTSANNLREITSRIFPSQMLHIIIAFIFLHSLFLSQTSENLSLKISSTGILLS